MMGWNQPVVSSGKRGRHSSTDERSSGDTNGGGGGAGGGAAEDDGETDNMTDDTVVTHFGKRPREVSPLSADDTYSSSMTVENNPPLPLPPTINTTTDGNKQTTTSKTTTLCASCNNDSAVGAVLKHNAVCSTSEEEYSVSVTDLNVINMESTDTSSMDLAMTILGPGKIRTFLPKSFKKAQKSGKGPSIPAGRSRTACPRKMSPIKRKAKKISIRKGNSHDGSDDLEEEDFVDLPSDTEESDSLYEGEQSVISNSSTTASTSVDVDPITETDAPEIILPAIRPSYFPFVPPYINFCLHNQKTEDLPTEIQKHMKWRLSNITPLVVKKTLSNSGFRLLRKTTEWGGHWGRHMKAALFKTTLKDYQKLNHFPATFQIGRKDRLWRNIQRYMTKFGKEEFGFMPKTFILPIETKQLKAAWDSSEAKGHLWIVKPPALARGTGIRVINKWSQVPKKKQIIVQAYIGNPYLINERKFDLRLYVLVTSFHPLKVYLYNDGLVRFAPLKYSSDTKRAADRFMHLTNYSINKNCELYSQNTDAESSEGHKWTLRTLWRYLRKEGKDVENLWHQIEEIVIKTLICAEDPIVNACTCYLPNLYNGYELFGFDIILDSALKPWLLEVNISPSLHSSSPLDLAVKGPMIKETLNIAGFQLPPKISQTMKEMFVNSLDVELDLETPTFDKRIYANNSLSKEEQAKHKLYKTRSAARCEYIDDILENLMPDDVRQLILAEDELSQCENFCRIFPNNATYMYSSFFEMPRYYNMLLDAWEDQYQDDRPEGVKRLIELCKRRIHLQVPVMGGDSSVTSESQGPEHEQNGAQNQDYANGVDINNGMSEVSEEETTSPRENHNHTNGMDEMKSDSTDSINSEKKCMEMETPQVPPISTVITTPPAVLDNITNSCSRTVGSPCPCHVPDRVQPKASNSTIPGKITDLPKGICF